MELLEILNTDPDERGIIEVVLDGQPRRFIKDKLLNYLQRSHPTNIKVGKGVTKRKPVIAITPDNKELKFESSAEAARNLNICRTNIPHALSGRYSHVNGYRFRYANETSNN